jgi:Protein of unknown function (DUF1761)
MDVNYLAVAVAAVAAPVASTVWYTLINKQYAAVSGAARAAATTSPGPRPAPTKIVLELVRSLVVAAVVAGLFSRLHPASWSAPFGLALVTWIAFPVVLLTGSVQWENVPWRLAAIHAGDWLVKLLLICGIVGLWR